MQAVNVNDAVVRQVGPRSLAPGNLAGVEFEQHYSVESVAKMWGLGVDKTRELFRDDPSVLKIGSAETRFKRGYISLRIPESAIRRVHQQLRVN